MRDTSVLDQPIKILALSGSLRRASSNTAAIRALAVLGAPSVRITLFDQLDQIPPFNPDLDGEAAIPPSAVRALRSAIASVDGLLICTPEYAHGVPGVLKNALDWLVSSTEFPGKQAALLNISPRSKHVQDSLEEILRTMSAALIQDPALTLELPRDRLELTAMLEDPQVRQALQAALDVFVRAVRANAAGA